MLKLWDFKMLCDDGAEVYLHPSWTKTKFPCYRGAKDQDHEILASGMGGTSGAGTCKRNVAVQSMNQSSAIVAHLRPQSRRIIFSHSFFDRSRGILSHSLFDRSRGACWDKVDHVMKKQNNYINYILYYIY